MDVYTEKFLTDTLKEVAGDEEVHKVVEYFNTNQGDAAWQKDMDLVHQWHVNSTPTILLNGQVAKTLEDIRDMVNKASKKNKDE